MFRRKNMYTPMMATLRYGRLGNGMGIPCAYALEREDGTSILFQTDHLSLAYYLGAKVDPDNIRHHNKAIKWLDRNVGREFNIADSYGTLDDEAWG
jgi:hypothetical protein